MPVRSLVVLPITILAANNIFILTNLSYSSNILQRNKPTRLKRINMFVTSIKFLFSALLYLSVAENQLQEGGEGAFSRVLDFILPVATVFAMGSMGPL